MKNEKNKAAKAPDAKNNYDPYVSDPGAGLPGDDRVRQADEMEARQRADVGPISTDRLDDSTTSPIVHTGIPGQTTRGSYGFNDSTGQGEYMDRTRDGAVDVGADAIEQASDHFGSLEANEQDRTDVEDDL